MPLALANPHSLRLHLNPTIRFGLHPLTQLTSEGTHNVRLVQPACSVGVGLYTSPKGTRQVALVFSIHGNTIDKLFWFLVQALGIWLRQVVLQGCGKDRESNVGLMSVSSNTRRSQILNRNVASIQQDIKAWVLPFSGGYLSS